MGANNTYPIGILKIGNTNPTQARTLFRQAEIRKQHLCKFILVNISFWLLCEPKSATPLQTHTLLFAGLACFAVQESLCFAVIHLD